MPITRTTCSLELCDCQIIYTVDTDLPAAQQTATVVESDPCDIHAPIVGGQDLLASLQKGSVRLGAALTEAARLEPVLFKELMWWLETPDTIKFQVNITPKDQAETSKVAALVAALERVSDDAVVKTGADTGDVVRT